MISVDPGKVAFVAQGEAPEVASSAVDKGSLLSFFFFPCLSDPSFPVSRFRFFLVFSVTDTARQSASDVYIVLG